MICPRMCSYRNGIRGHKALGGKPSITRLQEYTEKAPAHILDRLESYAVYEIGRQKVNMDGSIRSLGRSAQLDGRAVWTGSDPVRDLARARGNDAGRPMVSVPGLPALPAAQFYRPLGYAGELLVRKIVRVPLSANCCRKLTVTLYIFWVERRHRDLNEHMKGRGGAGAPSDKYDLMSPLWGIIDI